MDDDKDGTLDCWCIVELFGHARIAGHVTEDVIAGQGFVRVDVPTLPIRGNMPEQTGFTRLFGPSAIYSITPVDETIATRAADSMRVEPVNVYMALPMLGQGVDWGKVDPDDQPDLGDDDDDDAEEDDDLDLEPPF